MNNTTRTRSTDTTEGDVEFSLAGRRMTATWLGWDQLQVGQLVVDGPAAGRTWARENSVQVVRSVELLNDGGNGVDVVLSDGTEVHGSVNLVRLLALPVGELV